MNTSSKILFSSLAIVLVALLLWNFVLLPRNAVVSVEPPMLPPDGVSTAAIRVKTLNRIGTAIPFQHTKLRVEIQQGAGLVTIRYNADSTEALLRAAQNEGRVEMRVTGDGLPFPMFAVLDVVTPMAGIMWPASGE